MKCAITSAMMVAVGSNSGRGTDTANRPLVTHQVILPASIDAVRQVHFPGDITFAHGSIRARYAMQIAQTGSSGMTSTNDTYAAASIAAAETTKITAMSTAAHM